MIIKTKIPLSKPFLGDEEKKASLRVINSNILSRGRETENFELEFKNYVGKKYAVAVSNGTSGLHLAVRALGWKKGDEIITSPYSFIASGNVLLYEGIKPVFADIDSKTFNIDPREIEKKITKNTKGILLIHVFGLPVNYKEIKKIVEKYNLDVIEDACEALGKPSEDFPVGRLGDICVYSFYENKPLTSGGEGGMIATNDAKFYQYCKSARDQGRSNEKGWLNHVILGYNYRMTEIQAAIGAEQLKKLDKLLFERRKIAKIYYNNLKNCGYLETLKFELDYRRNWVFYIIKFKDSKLREKAISAFAAKGISSHVYFPPIHLFPTYKDLGYRKGDFPVSEAISETTLAIPFYPYMSKEEIFLISNILKNL